MGLTGALVGTGGIVGFGVGGGVGGMVGGKVGGDVGAAGKVSATFVVALQVTPGAA